MIFSTFPPFPLNLALFFQRILNGFRDLKIPSNSYGILDILEGGDHLKSVETYQNPLFSIRSNGFNGNPYLRVRNPLNPYLTDAEIRWNGWKSVPYGYPLNPLIWYNGSVPTDAEIRSNGWKSVGTDGNPLERMEIRTLRMRKIR